MEYLGLCQTSMMKTTSSGVSHVSFLDIAGGCGSKKLAIPVTFWSQLFCSNVANITVIESPITNQMAPKLAFTCSKLTIETLEKDVKYVQS